MVNKANLGPAVGKAEGKTAKGSKEKLLPTGTVL
jgi:hypothetical protein